MRVPSVLSIVAWATIQASEAIRLERSFLSLSAHAEASAQETATRESLQDALDKLCRVEAEAACQSGLSHYCNMPVYARYDGRSNNVDSKEWRCYAEDALNFEVVRASCVDTCGKLKMCLGAYGGSSASYLSRHSKLSSQLDELKPEYCSAPAPTLQEALDRKCAEFGEEACEQGLWAYCDVTMYARYDVGTASQKAREWRCYAQDALDFDISGNGCVDDCGNFTSCRGAVNGTSSTHLSRVGQLTDFMNSNRDFYCPSPTEEAPVESEDVDSAEASESTTLSSNPTSNLQSALDKVCAEEGKKACGQGLQAYCDTDMFARHDVGTESQRNREWRCYARVSLDFGISGDGCVDDCGNLISCLGAVNGTSTTHLSRDAQVASAIDANKGEFCGRTSESPEASGKEDSVEVEETTTTPPSRPLRMQHFVDEFCLEEAKRACQNGLSAYCDASVSARYDVGTEQQRTREWRCYVDDSLDFGLSGDGCVDDCGNLISCPGAVNGTSTTHLTRDDAVNTAIDSKLDEFCNPTSEPPEASGKDDSVEVQGTTTTPPSRPLRMQHFVDEFCLEEAKRACQNGLSAYCDASVSARHDVGTEQQRTREWRCYVDDSLDFGLSGDGCVDDCGNLISCPGAVNGTSTTHLTRDDAVNTAIDSKLDEFCNPTSEPPEASGKEDSVEVQGTTTTPPSRPLRMQHFVDEFCLEEAKRACQNGLSAYCDASVSARHDVGTEQQRTREWRCYVDDSLDFGLSGDGCVDDCGNLISCPGAVNGTSTTHLTRDDAVNTAIDSKLDEFCNPTSEPPEASGKEDSVEVEETTTTPPSRPLRMQHFVDEFCLEEAKRACQNGLSAYCDASVSARHDVGTEQQRTREWRCYVDDSLDFGLSGDGCVDDCGNLISCPGAVNGTSTTHLTRDDAVNTAIDSKLDEFCNPTSEPPEASGKEDSVEVEETTTTPPSRPLRMQHFVDEFCLEEAKRACQNGLSAYCDASVSARHDVGTEQQRTREWRCYVDDSLDFGLSGDGCVDDCGNLISCPGAVNGTSTTHLTRDDAVNTAIDSKLDEFCNPTSEPPEASEKKESVEVPETTALPSNPPSNLQALVDGLCAEEGRKACGQGLQAYCDTDMFARHDVGTGSQRNREWRCYARVSLDFGISGDGCVDDCGNLTSCLGAVNGSSTTHLSRGERIQKLIDTEKAGRCTPEEGEEAGGSPAPAPVPELPAGVPASEVSDKGLKVPPRVPGGGALQEMADVRCMVFFAKQCVTDESMCQYAVARKIDSTWKCYPYGAVDDSQSGDACTDDCGNAINCPGIPKNGDADGMRIPALDHLFEELKSATCKMSKQQELKKVHVHRQ